MFQPGKHLEGGWEHCQNFYLRHAYDQTWQKRRGGSTLDLENFLSGNYPASPLRPIKKYAKHKSQQNFQLWSLEHEVGWNIGSSQGGRLWTTSIKQVYC